ncbi:MAG: 23S rRNA (guanosine(2251)-2'-O)-methyltransferase RlmB [Acetobacterium woodii]|nr:23S rRNA (guanosine(2251)-2'-O)-methyltransferase RlmB [Acetobacterium woodii]
MKKISNSRSNSSKTSDKPRSKKNDQASKSSESKYSTKGDKRSNSADERGPKTGKSSHKFEERGAKDDKKPRKFDSRGPKEDRGPRRFDDRRPARKFDGHNREDDGITEETFVIVGKNPVMEALRSGQEIDKLLILKDNTDHVLKKITDMAKKQNIIIHSVEKARLEYLADGQVHQGIVALMAPFPYSNLQDILNHAKAKGRDPFIVILDHLTDPHNLGAIIRSANVCGADGVIIPNRRSASLTAVSVKASSGAVSHTPIVKVTNLSQTIDDLKKKGFWIMSTDMKGNPYYKADYKGSLAIVIGNEGTGISEKIKKQCDFAVSIPIHGEIESFNASAAAAIIFAEAAKQRFQ